MCCTLYASKSVGYINIAMYTYCFPIILRASKLPVPNFIYTVHGRCADNCVAYNNVTYMATNNIYLYINVLCIYM